MNILNPEYKPHRALGESDVDWDNLKAKLRTFLSDNADKPTVTVDDARDIDLKFQDDNIWRQMVGDMELFIVPG